MTELFFILVGGLLILQYFLSIQENKLLRWILPSIAFISSFFYTMYMKDSSNNPLILLFVFGNIPTLVFTCIAFASKDLDKLTNRKR